MRSDAFHEKLTRSLILMFVLLAFALVVASSPARAGDRHVSVGVSIGGEHGAISVGYHRDSGDHHAERAHHRRGHHGHYKRHHRYVPRHRHHRYASFVVPRHLRHGHWGSYYTGRVWVPAHRHHHTIYDFPVAYRGGYVYRPHAYCNDALYVAGDLAWDGGYVRVRYGY